MNAFFATLLAFAADPIALKARVTDQTGLLSNSAVRAIESLSESLERDTKVQLAVFVVPDLGGRSIEEFSLKTAELSGLGQKKKDNGVLLVVARGSREMRIEVGYGLEGILTDVVSSRIIRNVMVPEFRAGRFDSGVIHGTQAIADRVRDPNAAEVQGDAQGEFRRPALRHSLSLLVIILFALLFGTIASFQNRHRFRRRGGWWNFPPSGGGFGGRSGGGFGGFGGGGFSGGGGSFGGGGASGRW